LSLAVPCFAFAYGISGNHLPTAAACALGCVLGVPLTPDLDQEGLNSSEHSIIKWTFGLGFIWVMLWYPYARLCKHRSPLSHWPLLGTLGRLLYMTVFVGIAVALGWKIPPLPTALLSWGLGGLALSDGAHWLLDSTLGDRRRR
jgi:uncharacterized metal-binding protein